MGFCTLCCYVTAITYLYAVSVIGDRVNEGSCEALSHDCVENNGHLLSNIETCRLNKEHTFDSPVDSELELDLSEKAVRSEDTLEVAAVGRVAQMGELYDARSDKFLRISLVNGNFSSFIKSTQNKHSTIEYLELNTLTEKLQKLDVKAGFTLSVLSGLITVSGSGEYIQDTKQSTKSAKVSVTNFITTELEQIDVASQEVQPFINLDVLQKIEATHVVVAIQWGGNVIVSVEDYNTENASEVDIIGNLSGTLKQVVASISIDGSVNISDEEKKKLEQFSFVLYGDVLPEHLPTSLLDSIVLIQTTPKMLLDGNSGKGTALKYTLYPMDRVSDFLNVKTKISSLVALIDQETVNSCVEFFGDLNNVELKIKDLTNEVKTFENYISIEKINKIHLFDNNFRNYQSRFKEVLSELLIKVRSDNQSVDELLKAVENAKSNELSPSKIDFSQFDLILNEFKFIKLLNSFSAKVLDKTTSFNEFMSMNLNKNIYAFFYLVEYPNLKDEPMIAFRTFVDKGDAFDPIGIFVAIKFDVLANEERKTYFNFEGPNRLRLYHNGNLLIDNYTLSTKPYAPVPEGTVYTTIGNKTIFAGNELVKVNFFRAIQQCAMYGWQLAAIESDEETEAVEKMISDNGLRNSSFWLSGNDVFEESGTNDSRTFYWLLKGKPLRYSNWSKGEPSSPSENCIQLWRGFHFEDPTFTWNDLSCLYALNYLCEQITIV